MRILGVIPARGGSARFPRKNLATLCGKPLLAYTAEAARASGRIERLVISTDTPEIAELAEALGIEAPFLRPASLAADAVPGIDPFLHAVEWLIEEEGYRPDCALLLQPTSPLRSESDIRQAADLLIENEADQVIGLKPLRGDPGWLKQLGPDLTIESAGAVTGGGTQSASRQLYVVNGAIYLTRTEILLASREFYAGKTCGYVMPPDRSLDIDSPLDLALAEAILCGGASNA